MSLRASKAEAVPASMTPLFIPLKAEYFDEFEAGIKVWEFRLYGPRWNERTCPPGRAVVLSRGYGIKRRLYGVVAAFERSAEPTKTEAWRKCYGDRGGDAACIRVALNANNQGDSGGFIAGGSHGFPG